MAHGIEVAEENYLRRDPQVDKQIEKKAKMAKANEDKLRTDIAIGNRIVSQMYKERMQEFS